MSSACSEHAGEHPRKQPFSPSLATTRRAGRLGPLKEEALPFFNARWGTIAPVWSFTTTDAASPPRTSGHTIGVCMARIGLKTAQNSSTAPQQLITASLHYPPKESGHRDKDAELREAVNYPHSQEVDSITGDFNARHAMWCPRTRRNARNAGPDCIELGKYPHQLTRTSDCTIANGHQVTRPTPPDGGICYHARSCEPPGRQWPLSTPRDDSEHDT